MNRIWAAVAIAVIITLFCTVGIFTAAKSTSEILSSLEEMKQSADAGETEKAVEQNEKLLREWKDRSRILSTYIPHSHLDCVSQSIASLSPLLVYGDRGEFESEYRKAQLQIEFVLHAELPTLDNIF